jgi:hypothetical protein
MEYKPEDHVKINGFRKIHDIDYVDITTEESGTMISMPIDEFDKQYSIDLMSATYHKNATV